MKKDRSTGKSTDRKQAIVKAAIACFIKDGIVKTTFTEIAKRAHVHQPLISYYFPDFETLFAAVVQTLLEELKTLSIETIAKHSDPRTALLDYSQIPIAWAKQRPEYNALWTFFYHLASYHPMFQAINNSIRTTGRERISLLLYQYQEAEKLTLTPAWNIQRLAYVIQAHITGELSTAVTEKSDLDAAASICRQAVEALLDQVLIKPKR